MALQLMLRQVARLPVRSTSVRMISIKDIRLYTDEELFTGVAKKELLARKAGNKDPFNMGGVKRGVGTKEQPNLVPSMMNQRIVGCVCEEDSTYIVYMWLHKGEPKRCKCGHWFKLVEGKFLEV